jgi:hypothetical protein
MSAPAAALLQCEEARDVLACLQTSRKWWALKCEPDDEINSTS